MFRKLLFILLAPLVIALGLPIFLFVIVFLGCTILWHLPARIAANFRLKTTLRKKGRCCIPGFDANNIVAGTLILDSPTLGWGLQRCWWTPDDVRAIAPISIPSEEDRELHLRSKPNKLSLPFDVWCYDTYVSPDTGTAVLLAANRGDDYSECLIRKSPKLASVRCWSAPVEIERSSESIGMTPPPKG